MERFAAPTSPHPSWITPELIRRTLGVWQKRSPMPLSEADALDILVTVGHLADLLNDPPKCNGQWVKETGALAACTTARPRATG